MKDIRKTMDEGAMAPFQWLAVAICTLLIMLDGFDVLVMAFTASAVAAEWKLNGAQLGVLFSAGLIGMALGSLFLAPFGGLLALLACLGLARLSHETTPALSQLCLGALLFFGLATLPRHRIQSGMAIAVGMLGLTLSGAPTVALWLGDLYHGVFAALGHLTQVPGVCRGQLLIAQGAVVLHRLVGQGVLALLMLLPAAFASLRGWAGVRLHMRDPKFWLGPLAFIVACSVCRASCMWVARSSGTSPCSSGAVFQRDIRVENIASLRVSAAVMGALLGGGWRWAQAGINMGVTLGTARPRVDFRPGNSA